MSKLNYSLLILSSLIYYSCEAPRDNPLDTNADGYHSINGYVQTFSLPYTPLSDVAVYWAPSNTMTITDSTGKFLIPNATAVNSYLIFRKAGFRSDSVMINWGSQKNLSVQISMNKIPMLDSSSIYTSVINNADNSRTFEVIIRVWISDQDKDIDSVIVENTKLNLRKSLEYDLINKYYQVSFGSDELSINDIEDTIGENFNFYVIDISGSTYMVGNNRVTRVIRTGATIVSPDNSTTDQLPLLTWKKFIPGYYLTYTVEVFKNDPGNPQLVYRNSGIPMDSTSLKVTNNLAAANYFWVIWTMDSFNNNSRSRPAAFNVR